MYRFDPGSTDVTIYFKLRSDTTGLPVTGLAFNSAGANASYTRKGASAASITLATLAAANSAHSDGGFKEVDATLAPGLYRLDLPDAACASGVPFVVASIKFSGVIAESVLVRLDPNLSSTGAGAVSTTITVKSSVGGTPIQGAEVWVTTDSVGTNVIAGTLTTNNFGQVTFFLDPGTYYVWIAAPDYTEPNPTTIVVT